MTHQHYNFLSIGDRGVGKTVFFVGNYAEGSGSSATSLQFTCEDPDTQTIVDKIRHYIAKTGEYPAATMKIMNFDFQVWTKSSPNPSPLCDVCWWDTPGESCQLYNPAFLTMMLNVDGCCLFLDGLKLLQSAHHPQALQSQLSSLQSLAEVLHHNGYTYPIAVIITKCDLLPSDESKLTIRKAISPLIQQFEALGIRYRLFFSGIPLVEGASGIQLQVNPRENALMWLIEELLGAVSGTEPVVTVSSVKKALHYLSLRLGQKSLLLLPLVLITALLSVVGIFSLEHAVNSEQKVPADVPSQPLKEAL